MHIYVAASRYDRLDELLLRIRTARQRPAWHRRGRGDVVVHAPVGGEVHRLHPTETGARSIP